MSEVKELISSSEYKYEGLMSPSARKRELERIIKELRVPGDIIPESLDPDWREIHGAQDLCFRLYSKEMTELLAEILDVDPAKIRPALDQALLWSCYGESKT